MSTPGASPPSAPATVGPALRSWHFHSTPARALAWVTGGVGLVNLLDGLIPREPALIEEMEKLLPLSVPAGSQWLQAVAGLTLMLLARGLARQKRVAWMAAILGFGVLPVAHLLQSFRWPYALLALAMLIWLIGCRHHFVAKTAEPSVRFALKVLPVAALVVYATAFAMVWHVRAELEPIREDSLYRKITPREQLQKSTAAAQVAAELVFLGSTDTVLPTSNRSKAVLQLIPIGGPVLALFALVVLLRPVLPHDPPAGTDRERVRALILHHGTDPLDDFALLPDKHYFFSSDGQSVVSFALWRDFAVTLADPIGPVAVRPSATAEFIAHCRRNDWQPVFYEIGVETRDICAALGCASFKIAEDARLDLTTFKTEGKPFQRLRTALNHARKLGWVFRWYDPGVKIDHGLEAQLKLVSDEWLASHNGTEMTFDLGAFSGATLAHYGAAVLLDDTGRVESFSTWMPFDKGRGRSLDLMRCRQTTNVMDANLLLSLQHFKAQGITRISLGNAPLANIDAEIGNRLSREEKAVRYVYENFNKIYGYKSLFEFKDKFAPQWQPRFLAYKGATRLPMIALALAAVHTPGGLKKYLRS